MTQARRKRSQTHTRQVQKTRWYPAAGTVARDFDDVLVAGTGRVMPEHLAKLSPWPLQQARAYQPDYLAGYETLRFDPTYFPACNHPQRRHRRAEPSP